jgi:hypothetical protein
MRHGEAWGTTWPIDDPEVVWDPALTNVNAPMGIWLELEKLFCKCDGVCVCGPDFL